MEQWPIFFRGKDWQGLFQYLGSSAGHLKLLTRTCEIFLISSPHDEMSPKKEIIFTSKQAGSLAREECLVHWKKKLLTIGDQSYPIKNSWGPGVLFFLLPLQRWKEEDLQRQVVLTIPQKKIFSKIISQLFVFDRDDFSCGHIKNKGKNLYLIQIKKPPYFLLSQWLEDIPIYYSPQPNLFLPWGYTHPFSKAFTPSSSEWLFFHFSKKFEIPLPPLQSPYEFLQLKFPKGALRVWKNSSPPTALKMTLSLENTQKSLPPELWILPPESLQLLVEQVETMVPEQIDEFLIGKFSHSGETLYVLRRLHGQLSPGIFLGEGEPFARDPSLPGVFLPLQQKLYPPIHSMEQFQKSFHLSPEEFVVIRGKKKKLELLKMKFAGLSPLREILHYWIEGEQKQLEALLPQIEFDLTQSRWATPKEKQKESTTQPNLPEADAEPETGAPEIEVRQDFKDQENFSSAIWREWALMEERKSQKEGALLCWTEALWTSKGSEEFLATALEMAQYHHPLPSFMKFLDRPQKILDCIPGHYEELRNLDLPKKQQWLFWKKITEITKDDAELFFQGESLLSELNRRGAGPLPSVLLKNLERKFFEKNRTLGKKFLGHFWGELEKEEFHIPWHLGLCTSLASTYLQLDDSTKALEILEKVTAGLEDELALKDRAFLMISMALIFIRGGFLRGDGLLEEVFTLIEQDDFSNVNPMEILVKLIKEISSLPASQAHPWEKKIFHVLENLSHRDQLAVFSQCWQSLIALSHRDKVEKFILDHLELSPSSPMIFLLLKAYVQLKKTPFLPPELLPKFPLALPFKGDFPHLHPHRDFYILLGLSHLMATPPPSLDHLFQKCPTETYSSHLTRVLGIRYFLEKKDSSQAFTHLVQALKSAEKISEEGIRLACFINLIELIPLVGRPRQGGELLSATIEKQGDFLHPSRRATFLNYCMKAGGKLGQDEETLKIWREVIHLFSEFNLLQNNPLFFEVFSVGLEGLFQLRSNKKAQDLLLEIYSILETNIGNSSPDAYLESTLYQPVVRFARVALFFDLGPQIFKSLQLVLSRTAQILLYDPSALELYREVIQIVLSLEGERRYQYLSQIFSQLLPYCHRPGVVSEAIVDLLKKTLENLFSFQKSYQKYLENYKNRWEEDFRKTLVLSMFLFDS